MSRVPDKKLNYNAENPALPGRPLSPKELKALIKKNRQTETISMDAGHAMLRKKFGAE